MLLRTAIVGPTPPPGQTGPPHEVRSRLRLSRIKPITAFAQHAIKHAVIGLSRLAPSHAGGF